MSKTDKDQLEVWLKAISSQLRRSILAMLWERRDGPPVSPTQIAAELDEKLSTVGYHIRRLHAWKVVELVTTKPSASSIQHFYKLAGSFGSQSWVVAFITEECLG